MTWARKDFIYHWSSQVLVSCGHELNTAKMYKYLISGILKSWSVNSYSGLCLALEICHARPRIWWWADESFICLFQLHWRNTMSIMDRSQSESSSTVMVLVMDSWLLLLSTKLPRLSHALRNLGKIMSKLCTSLMFIRSARSAVLLLSVWFSLTSLPLPTQSWFAEKV